MQTIYDANAVLTFSIATDTISFPHRVVGLDDITKTLIVDFGTKFSRCKTYYICDFTPQQEDRIAILPWLVLMCESASSRLRIGKGYYKWTFEKRSDANTQVAAMHIHIERMDIIDDRDGKILHAMQSALSYPWLPPALLLEKFEQLMQRTPGFEFLDIFKTPFQAIPTTRRRDRAGKATAEQIGGRSAKN
ncbi:MAG: hypothetical protein HY067_03315 [Betaproteobacteria bacterium]|nr:hypothetical protein [Betaproteobacteria bacterium]